METTMFPTQSMMAAPEPDAAPREAAGQETEAASASVSSLSARPLVERGDALRGLEALLFAASEPLSESKLASFLGGGVDVAPLLEELRGFYASRGVNLARVAGKWAFRTADDMRHLLERHAREERRLSRAALETLAIIAYHQPVTRAEIEDIRGVVTSKGTLDVLLETGWIRPRGRRRAPGRPVTYGTTESFLVYFGLDGVKDLPGLAELKGAGLLDGNLPAGFMVPEPNDAAALRRDEAALDSLDGDAGQEELSLGAAAPETATEEGGAAPRSGV